MNKKKTTPNIAHLASEILTNPNSSRIQKQLAASALSQSQADKQTGVEMETIASRVLASNKYNNITKTLAGSILSQSNKQR
ncbi:hypothetical protein [uncultured Anaeromusa sp.]|uniref:hypothetical protein n=1 Tax=uncultured Anaeromusa sp. TaxID=673273 RepID=UPI0029C79733|nr:hypothetical protein [uncultured Anaeromusa sp.]